MSVCFLTMSSSFLQHISVSGLAYCHANCLIIFLNKAETEKDCIEDDDKIKKQPGIDRHGPKPFSNIASLPNKPPHFSLPTTLKG
jgi:hypothetical protein